MKHGDMCLLKRGRRKYWVKVLSDHTATFAAITVQHGEEEWIVGINDLVTTEEVKAEEDAKRAKAVESVQDIVEAFNAGHHGFGAMARAMNSTQVKILSRVRKAERLGLIKMERRYEPKKESSAGDQTKPMCSLSQAGLLHVGGPVPPVYAGSEPKAVHDEGREPRLAPPSGGGPSIPTKTSQNGETGTTT